MGIMRRRLVVGAQKLYLSLRDSIRFAQDLRSAVGDKPFSFELGVCPSFVNLAHVSEVLQGSRIGLGAQNVHQEDSGAFTGQVSIRELLDLEVRYVIVGHSELRIQQNETNGMVNKKVTTCLKHGVIPIVCVGETLDDRQAGRSKSVIEKDLKDAFAGISKEEFPVDRVVVAYEPLWAIKSGKADKQTAAATPEMASDIHQFIRSLLVELYPDEIAKAVRILYGGSVNGTNAPELLAQPSIDGLLVGTASANLATFLPILDAADRNRLASLAT
jgi:triosephosphate isomerase